MPKFRGVPKPKFVAPEPPAAPAGPFRLQESQAVTSTWAWRAFAMMALVMLGLFINFAVQHYKLFYVVGWGAITAVWLAFAMYLWRQHTRWVNGEDL